VEREAPAARDLLEAGFAELELDLTADRREKLLALAVLLAAWAPRLNLTAHRSQTAIVHRLILDAVALSQALPEEPGSLADLGSGAGFPGLPLAVLWPGTRVTLIESRERRVHFQRAAIRALEVRNVRALWGRSDQITREPQDLVIAQALAAPDRALQLLVPWSRPGGLLALPGAEQPPAPAEHPDVTALGVQRYRVPCGGPERTLWLGRRNA
jgi:16S rRNA (guanine527-N7)-methyltransferase